MKSTVLGDRYELIEKIGEGGMSSVYKAHCRTLDRMVAVKILKDELLNDAGFVGKFNTEALAAAQLSHPNIVNIFDVGQQDDIYYIVMEYVEGKTLKELIEEEAPLGLEKAIDIAIMICDGIHHAHTKGIIHRDIKPYNILITRDGMVKVADFGIAQAISKKTITFGGDIVGSVHYIAPEQAKGEAISPATDIYSLGCVLYEMVTAQMPFDAESPITVALKHIHDKPAEPKSINTQIPDSLQNIILKAMEKNPVNRFTNAEQMRDALLEIHSSKFVNYSRKHASGKTMVIPALDDEGSTVGKRKLRSPNIVLAIIAILGLLGGVFYTLGSNFFPDEIAVPDIVGLSIKEADLELSKYNLDMTVIAREASDEYGKDIVIYQDPVKGLKVKEGREIKVKISTGSELFKVPSVVGLTAGDAEINLRNEGFVIGSTEKIFDDKYAENFVISQKPEAGSRVKRGSRVNLMISKGKTPEKIAMPNLLGLSLEEASKKLGENNLILGEVKHQDSSEYYLDQVMAQGVQADVLVDQQSTIDLTISKGPGPVAATKNIEFKLPSDMEYYRVQIKLRDSKGERQVYNENHRGSENVYVAVNYFGAGVAEILLNGNSKPYKTFKL
ncbi:MAG: protein kinase [Syntrophomonadaceae bacterium]|nr:protein kinase [Syntrophomonadaceae bacterium]MDD3022635.1 protein kinase [Syntrophomonadaceae bacterium]